mmetsp:Transcript_17768/g.36446  ORF Transcript_17768/g.36446 Transcript_17768/m.36446 type:complete len:257 (-) Transcript_17768:165-935(-)
MCSKEWPPPRVSGRLVSMFLPTSKVCKRVMYPIDSGMARNWLFSKFKCSRFVKRPMVEGSSKMLLSFKTRTRSFESCTSLSFSNDILLFVSVSLCSLFRNEMLSSKASSLLFDASSALMSGPCSYAALGILVRSSSLSETIPVALHVSARLSWDCFFVSSELVLGPNHAHPMLPLPPTQQAATTKKETTYSLHNQPSTQLHRGLRHRPLRTPTLNTQSCTSGLGERMRQEGKVAAPAMPKVHHAPRSKPLDSSAPK